MTEPKTPSPGAAASPASPAAAIDGRPARQSRTGLTSTGARKASAKSNRTRAREFALQALYQHLVGGNEAAAIDEFTRDLAGFHKADAAHYDALLHGCIHEAAGLDALIVPLLDRELAHISPIEHAVMWIGVYEFRHCLDVPWRVVLNECIELAKEFGGTDGHKYVNAVLNGLAPTLRALEVEADRARPGRERARAAPGPRQPQGAAAAAQEGGRDARRDPAPADIGNDPGHEPPARTDVETDARIAAVPAPEPDAP